MKIFLNDEIHEVSEGSTLLSLTQELGRGDLSGWAVAINETVVPKSDLEGTLLSENDRILFIQATQGG